MGRKKGDTNKLYYRWIVVDENTDKAKCYRNINEIIDDFPKMTRNYINEHIVRFERLRLDRSNLPEYYKHLRIQQIDVKMKPDVEYLNEHHICECGGKYTTINHLNHTKSKKHKKWVMEKQVLKEN